MPSTQESVDFTAFVQFPSSAATDDGMQLESSNPASTSNGTLVVLAPSSPPCSTAVSQAHAPTASQWVTEISHDAGIPTAHDGVATVATSSISPSEKPHASASPMFISTLSVEEVKDEESEAGLPILPILSIEISGDEEVNRMALKSEIPDSEDLSSPEKWSYVVEKRFGDESARGSEEVEQMGEVHSVDGNMVGELGNAISGNDLVEQKGVNSAREPSSPPRYDRNSNASQNADDADVNASLDLGLFGRAGACDFPKSSAKMEGSHSNLPIVDLSLSKDSADTCKTNFPKKPQSDVFDALHETVQRVIEDSDADSPVSGAHLDEPISCAEDKPSTKTLSPLMSSLNSDTQAAAASLSNIVQGHITELVEDMQSTLPDDEVSLVSTDTADRAAVLEEAIPILETSDTIMEDTNASPKNADNFKDRPASIVNSPDAEDAVPHAPGRLSSKKFDAKLPAPKKGRKHSTRKSESSTNLVEIVCPDDHEIDESKLEQDLAVVDMTKSYGLHEAPIIPKTRTKSNRSSKSAELDPSQLLETTEQSKQDTTMPDETSVLHPNKAEETQSKTTKLARKPSVRGGKTSGTSKKRPAEDEVDQTTGSITTNVTSNIVGKLVDPPTSLNSSIIPSLLPPKGNPQSKDVLMAELKAIKMASIQARNAALEAEIATKRAKLAELTETLTHPAADTVKRHIKLLHDYNDIRDVRQGLIGMIADNRGVRIGELYEEFGVGLRD